MQTEQTESTEETQSYDFSDILNGTKILNSLNALGIFEPTPIQRASLAKTIAGHDAVLQAATGSGKTFAYSIPLVNKLEESNEVCREHTFALVVAPTRELASQVSKVIQSINSSLAPVLLIGGESPEKQKQALKLNPTIVVGTPGRILDFMSSKDLKLNKCRFFVLDEADEMLATGFIDDIRKILSRLPDKRQGILVSATITPRVDMMASAFLSSPEIIAISSGDDQTPAIEHLHCSVAG